MPPLYFDAILFEFSLLPFSILIAFAAIADAAAFHAMPLEVMPPLLRYAFAITLPLMPLPIDDDYCLRH